MKKTLTILALATSTILSPTLHAAPSHEERAAQLQTELKTSIAAIKAKAADLQDERPSDFAVAIGIDCDIKMSTQEIKLHLPEVKMVLQKWSFHLPEIFWDTTTIGPIKLHLPQFRMKLHKIKLHVPELYMKLQTIKFDLPEFYCKNPRVEIDRINAGIEALAAESQALAERYRRDLKVVQRAAIEEKRDITLKQFDDAIAGMQAWINKVNKLKGNTVELRANLQKMKNQRETVRKSFEESLRKLS